MTDDSCLQTWRSRLTASCDRAQALASDLNAEQINWRPNADAWSVGQCLEHLLIGAGEYHAKLAPAVARMLTQDKLRGEFTHPRHTFMGKLIIRAVDPENVRPMKSPRVFAPAQSDVAGDVVKRFVASHQQIIQLMDDCQGYNINRLRLGSPVSPLIRINAPGAFQILTHHAERHLNQAQRVAETAEFPK